MPYVDKHGAITQGRAPLRAWNPLSWVIQCVCAVLRGVYVFLRSLLSPRWSLERARRAAQKRERPGGSAFRGSRRGGNGGGNGGGKFFGIFGGGGGGGKSNIAGMDSLPKAPGCGCSDSGGGCRG